MNFIKVTGISTNTKYLINAAEIIYCSQKANGNNTIIEIFNKAQNKSQRFTVQETVERIQEQIEVNLLNYKYN